MCGVWFVLGHLFAVLTVGVPYFFLSFIFFKIFFFIFLLCGEKVVGVLLFEFLWNWAEWVSRLCGRCRGSKTVG